MSCADYSQKAEDHQCFLVLIKHLGSHLKTSAFNKIYDRINTIQSVYLKETKRTICLRYKKTYSVANNDWGEFQAHRKVLGLICIGKCNSEADVEELYMTYHDIKNEYSSTLFNSRLLLLGVDDTEVYQEPPDITKDLPHVDSPVLDHPLALPHDGEAVVPPLPKQLPDLQEYEKQSVSRTSSNASTCSTSSIKDRTHVWFYPSVEECQDLEKKVQDFASSLFYVLESKRVDRSFEKKLSLLCTPFERKELNSIDTDTRNYRRKCQGRLRKHLGDLCLLAGKPGEALLHYQTALETLKSANDWLWLAGCYEGLCSASVIIMYPVRENTGFHRNFSLSTKIGSSMMQKANTKQRLGGSLQVNGLDLPEKQFRNCLAGDDIIEKYKEAIVHYSKFKEAGIVEMEASIKATRVFILQKKLIEASDFLQNVVYINLELSDEEKVQRYNTLSSLYKQIGFHRKSAFFKRVAAMQCVSAQNPKPAWITCYHLLLQSLEGYRIHLDPKEFEEERPGGWPSLQLRVLHELTYSARRMGDPALAVRNLSFVLHTMHDFLSPSEQIDISNTLETYSTKCEGTPHPLAIENGPILPPVALTHLPEIRSFKLLELSHSLEPKKKGTKNGRDIKRDASPFIYSPIVPSRQKFSRNEGDIKWVQDDVCEINIVVANPMPYELKVSSVGLLTSGVEFESHLANLTLPTGYDPHLLKILGTPKTVGKLNVIGYTTNVLGVKSHCKLKDIPHLKNTVHSVDIVPALPYLQVSTTMPRSRSLSNLLDCAISPNPSAIFKIYTGESHECQVSLSNMGKYPVTEIDVKLHSNLEMDLQKELFMWNTDNLVAQLPIEPGGQACFTLYMYGVGDYVDQDKVVFEECLNTTPLRNVSRPRSMRTASSVPNMLLQKSSSDTFAMQSSQHQTARTVEALLKFEYSGGPGLDAGYYRQCVVPLNLDILPSVMFKSWSISPGDSPQQCCISIDVVNKTDRGMEISLGSADPILLQDGDTRRVLLQMGRQDLPDITVSTNDGFTNPVAQKIADVFDISWKIPTLNKKGRASLDKLSWLPSHVGLLMNSPIKWDIHINDDLYVSNDVKIVKLADVVNLMITAHNNTDSIIQKASLHIKCYMHTPDHEDYTECTQEQIACLGCLKSSILQISPGNYERHDCSLLFNHQGIYYIDIRCHTDSEVWRHVPDIRIQVVSE